ncbi:MAG: RnfABCDGE type electron transport complex subunit B [Tissierellaceae bacterium]|nr:RnfABCDGE type electron transport complex subunit B [Tissierellaceae bacterium]
MTDILNPIIVLGGLGLGFGVLLSIASDIFHVDVDPKIEEIRSVLPGANCGACGFPGCDGLAAAIADGKAPVNGCSVGGMPVAERVAEIMGEDAEDMKKMVATVLCQGDCDKAKEKYEYQGITDCRAQNIQQAGSKSCTYGCLGGGTCQEVCEFDAIEMINGVAFVDKDKCTACMKCIEVCPKGIIELVPYENEFVVKCKSEDAGKVVRNNCSIGCIGCQICVKNCPVDAFSFENYLAKIDYDICTNCGICAEKCPTNAIFSSAVKELAV